MIDTAAERALLNRYRNLYNEGDPVIARAGDYLDEIDRLRDEAEILQTNVSRARGDVAVLKEWHNIDLDRLNAEVRRLKGEGQNFYDTMTPEEVARMYAEHTISLGDPDDVEGP